ncbi:MULTISPECIES: SAM-dependent methyltransferase [unclassified Pseudofrankia]|uniref:SAM-dependent methyltransferase n=1 Tax=unclassified Pseudofrankia TaxID=2994372 RepID=UPI0008DB192D|nr:MULTISPECIES: SAM-dependent methyltransferase [unclassified Pseudofrankia]MDT3446609.1 SAM-dependent methyltransferase [Pseudofrankia sp. BMG5.37]OHV62857.1 methyltransferase [Pseudofrankia sp. BMG5.36]
MASGSPESNASGTELYMDRPHSARMYDYYLGGKDSYPADQEAAELVLNDFPQAPTVARCNRAFLVRATRFLAAEAGIRQFLDVGTGIPTSPNLHEVAQSVAPDARVVYVDNDPLVLAHARALLTSRTGGATAYLDADLRDPEKTLASPEVRNTLDLSRPVALSLIAILHFIPDTADPYGIVTTLLDALPAGSYLTLTHATADFAPEQADKAAAIYQARGIPAQARSRDEVERFFTGLDMVSPGVEVAHRWRPHDEAADSILTDADVSCYAAVGRKPEWGSL